MFRRFYVQPVRGGVLVVAVALLAGLCAPSAFAKAAIHGTVTDRNGEPMAWVNTIGVAGEITS